MNDYNGCREMTFGPLDQKSFFFLEELVVNLTTSGYGISFKSNFYSTGVKVHVDTQYEFAF